MHELRASRHHRPARWRDRRRVRRRRAGERSRRRRTPSAWASCRSHRRARGRAAHRAARNSQGRLAGSARGLPSPRRRFRRETHRAVPWPGVSADRDWDGRKAYGWVERVRVTMSSFPGRALASAVAPGVRSLGQKRVHRCVEFLEPVSEWTQSFPRTRRRPDRATQSLRRPCLSCKVVRERFFGGRELFPRSPPFRKSAGTPRGSDGSSGSVVGCGCRNRSAARRD